MQQASIGAGYIKNMLTDRVNLFIHRTDAKPELPLHVVIRKAFNPNGEASWFGAIVALINQITNAYSGPDRGRARSESASTAPSSTSSRCR